MLVDERGRTVISSCGWVDHAGLWVFRSDTRKAEVIKISEAKYLAPIAGSHDYFSAVHHFDGTRVEITVHHFDEPSRVISTASLTPDGSSLLGDSSAWDYVQKYYTAYLVRPPISDSCLLCVRPKDNRVEIQQFGWYNTGYDKGYQGVTGVSEVPGSDHLIVAVQRSSELVIYNPQTQEKVRCIQLAGRHGNPSPFFRRFAAELWADDYDTIVKIDTATSLVLASRMLQPEVNGMRQFSGRFAFNREETLCIVARPFSGDAIGLDPSTFEIRYRCELGRQPLEAVVLPDNSIVARDWRSGTLLEGSLASV
jgi:hypothetical protein